MAINVEIPQRYILATFSNNIFTCDVNGNLYLNEGANPELKEIYLDGGYINAENIRWNSYYIYLGQSLKNNECFLVLEIEEGKELEQANKNFFVVYKNRNMRYNIKKFDEANNVLTQDQRQRLFAKMIDICKQQINDKWSV